VFGVSRVELLSQARICYQLCHAIQAFKRYFTFSFVIAQAIVDPGMDIYVSFEVFTRKNQPVMIG